MTGGSGTIRGFPSSIRVSLFSSCMLSRVRALASPLSSGLALALPEQAVEPGPELVDVHLGVPDVQVALAGQLPHDLPVARGRGEHDLPAVLVAEPVLPRGHLQAGRQPLHVPFPGRGQRLVEVVDVEDQPALGRAEEAEVGQVRVPARLHDHPGGRGAGQVAGHGQGRAAVVRERGLHHPAVPHRDQVRDPRRGLRLQQGDRVGSVRRRLPLAWLSRGTSARAALPRTRRSAGVWCCRGASSPVVALRGRTTVRRAASGTPAGTVVAAPFWAAARRVVVPREAGRAVLRVEARAVVRDDEDRAVPGDEARDVLRDAGEAGRAGARGPGGTGAGWAGTGPG